MTKFERDTTVICRSTSPTIYYGSLLIYAQMLSATLTDSIGVIPLVFLGLPDWSPGFSRSARTLKVLISMPLWNALGIVMRIASVWSAPVCGLRHRGCRATTLLPNCFPFTISTASSRPPCLTRCVRFASFIPCRRLIMGSFWVTMTTAISGAW